MRSLPVINFTFNDFFLFLLLTFFHQRIRHALMKFVMMKNNKYAISNFFLKTFAPFHILLIRRQRYYLSEG